MHLNKLKTTLLTNLFPSIISWNVDAKRVENKNYPPLLSQMKI